MAESTSSTSSKKYLLPFVNADGSSTEFNLCAGAMIGGTPGPVGVPCFLPNGTQITDKAIAESWSSKALPGMVPNPNALFDIFTNPNTGNMMFYNETANAYMTTPASNQEDPLSWCALSSSSSAAAAGGAASGTPTCPADSQALQWRSIGPRQSDLCSVLRLGSSFSDWCHMAADQAMGAPIISTGLIGNGQPRPDNGAQGNVVEMNRSLIGIREITAAKTCATNLFGAANPCLNQNPAVTSNPNGGGLFCCNDSSGCKIDSTSGFAYCPSCSAPSFQNMLDTPPCGGTNSASSSCFVAGGGCQCYPGLVTSQCALPTPFSNFKGASRQLSLQTASGACEAGLHGSACQYSDGGVAPPPAKKSWSMTTYVLVSASVVVGIAALVWLFGGRRKDILSTSIADEI